jgi:hypothetical protein
VSMIVVPVLTLAHLAEVRTASTACAKTIVNLEVSCFCDEYIIDKNNTVKSQIP